MNNRINKQFTNSRNAIIISLMVIVSILSLSGCGGDSNSPEATQSESSSGDIATGESESSSSTFVSKNSCEGEHIWEENGECYYTWKQAQTACLNGSHLPSKSELEKIRESKVYKNWPEAGNYYPDDGDVTNFGSYGSYRSATESNSENAWYLTFIVGDSSIYSDYKSSGLSVRCFQ